MPKLRTLRVHPNPYHFLDHEGRPHATFDADPIQHDPNARKIGVVKKQATLLVKRNSDVDDRDDIHDVLCHYTDEVQTLPDGTHEHGPSVHARMGLTQGARVLETKEKDGQITRTIVLPGALVAADEETAKAVGLPFADPCSLLAAARAHAIDSYTRDYGEPPAFATDPELEAHVPPFLRGQKPEAKAVGAPFAAKKEPAAAPKTAPSGGE